MDVLSLRLCRCCGLRSSDPRSRACFSRAVAVPFRKDTLFRPCPSSGIPVPVFVSGRTPIPFSNGRTAIRFCGEKAAPAQATGRLHPHLCNTSSRDGTARRGSTESGLHAHGKHKYTRKKTPTLTHSTPPPGGRW